MAKSCNIFTIYRDKDTKNHGGENEYPCNSIAFSEGQGATLFFICEGKGLSQLLEWAKVNLKQESLPLEGSNEQPVNPAA
jgi:hypothetical protein